jgi:DNA (cytosine-5)-methyltransferase 1
MERKPLTFGSLFAGIGGFDLGLERAGMVCKWQVELDDYASRVLAKHWPNVPRHDDVRTFPTAERDWSVDLICGGFPCQDISVAGKGAGLAGERSGLWYEFARIIRQIRPRWVIVENVRALTSRGLGTVLGDLADIGFDAEWHCVPACSVGAPHRRERIWIVAYANGEPNAVRGHGSSVQASVAARPCHAGGGDGHSGPRRKEVAGEGSGNVADASGGRVKGDRASGQQVAQPPAPAWLLGRDGPACGETYWSTEPAVGRLVDGFPNRLGGWGDAMRCLGNAVVPQVVEVIGRAIIEAEAKVTAA